MSEDRPVAERGNEVEAAVNSVVNDVSAIQAAFIVEITLELVIDVTDDGAETEAGAHKSINGTKEVRMLRHNPFGTYQSWLLMASPYPGVSTTVKRSFTPLSSISTVDASICTVLSIFSVGDRSRSS